MGTMSLLRTKQRSINKSSLSGRIIPATAASGIDCRDYPETVWHISASSHQSRMHNNQLPRKEDI